MGFTLRFFFIFLLSSSCCAVDYIREGYDPHLKKQIQFLASNGRTLQAIELYKEIKQKTNRHQTELLRELSFGILERGRTSKDPEILLMTLFGAGISLDESTAHIIAEAIESDIPELNLIALNFVSAFSNENAEMLLLKALRSNYLPIRLEAIYRLSLVRHPFALVQAEALFYKLEGEILGLFPDFFLMMDDPKASRIVKKLLMHSKSDVRIPTILGITKFHRDDFLPMIKAQVGQLDIAQAEASAFALGVFKDTDSLNKLKSMAKSSSENVKLSALRSIAMLGSDEAKKQIALIAMERNLFAIALLGDIPGSEDTLAKLTHDKDAGIKFNASMALLELKDPRCVKGISDILIKDSRDIAITKQSTIGKTLSYYKLKPSAEQNSSSEPLLGELSLKIKESILEKASLLKEKEFLQLAKTVFETRQNDLVPLLVTLLEGMETEGAINLLKEMTSALGAPLIRSYANLSLYRLGIEGPYFDNLKNWIQTQKNVPLIQLRPVLPINMRGEKSGFELAPEELSRLLVESFESFVKTQDERGIDILIDMIAHGNSKNRYALAGILLRGCL